MIINFYSNTCTFCTRAVNTQGKPKNVTYYSLHSQSQPNNKLYFTLKTIQNVPAYVNKITRVA